MSRTNKDKPWKFRYKSKCKDLPKVKREMDDTWHWMQGTPSWWTNLFMNRPLRRQAQQWERNLQKISDLEELEEVDKPNVSKKPHKYYW